MITAQNKSIVGGVEEREAHQIERRVRGWFGFDTVWWETVSTTHIGNDIHIKTDKEIRDIYLNGKKLPLTK